MHDGIPLAISMDTNEEPVPFVTSTVTSKEHVHRKLLETIYEAPKHSRDGSEQFTSIRKYKRFIDFTEAPSAAKKWKRTQKALKLASSRRVTVDPREEQVNGDTSSRRVRHSTRHKPEMAPSDRNNLVVSRCRKVSVARRKAIQQDEQALHIDDSCSSSQPQAPRSSLAGALKQDFSVIVVENGDLLIEEGATVELPYEMLECGVLDTGFLDVGAESDVQETVVQMLVTVDALASMRQSADGSSKTSNNSYCGDHADDVAGLTVSKRDTLGRSEIGVVDDGPQPWPPTEIAKARKRKVESTVEDDVAGAVGDLITIVDTTCFLCEVSSSVADHCSVIDCDTVDAAQAVCRVVGKVSSELSQEK